MPTFHEIPKAELHLHLGGSFPLDYLCGIASDAQREALLRNLDLIAGRVHYNEGFQVFGVIGQIVNTDEKVEKGTRALCEALQKDGVVYAEIRTGLKDLGGGPEGYLRAVLKGVQGAASESFHVRLLLSLQRASSLSQARNTVDLALKYRDEGIVGIDLSGDSTIGQVEMIIPELKRAKEAGLFLTVHMGESAKEVGQRQILEELSPHRIGHGVHLTEEAVDWIIENRIPIEVCPTSSVLVRMVDQYRDHPGLRYHSMGHPIVICTDDPLIFQNTLTGELAALSEAEALTSEELHQIARNAIHHAFLTDDEKQFFLERFFQID
ncbi:MAG: hypothetical protein JSS60_03855 [Verrucomicrobia bacterium]|nr:hypothetical protein [Verrucomicrobiota bacterium]